MNLLILKQNDSYTAKINGNEINGLDDYKILTDSDGNTEIELKIKLEGNNVVFESMKD